MLRKNILITGATSGIGAACASRFAKEGCNLILGGRRIERLENLSNKLTSKYGVKIYYSFLDITNNQSIINFVENLPEFCKNNIDVLVNNAGLALGIDKIYQADPKDWSIMIDTNIKGLLHISQLVLKNMIKINSGYIINIGSIAGHGVYPGGAVYCATKHAVRALSQGLRVDLSGTNIKVSLIEPGMVKTEFSLIRYKNNKKLAQNTYKGIKPLHAKDVADVVIYCAKTPAHVNIDEVIVMPLDQASLSITNRKK